MIVSLFLLTLLAGNVNAASAREVAHWIGTVRSVESEGRGNAEASRAWQRLAALNARHLPAVLAGMDGANNYALNWLRAAADAIVDRNQRTHKRLPVAALKRFLADTRHHPRARRYAYELIARADADTAKKLVPTFLDDPSNELRRDAVQQLIDQAAQSLSVGQTNAAVAAYEKSLRHARDVDQVNAVAKKLRELGHTVDLQRTFGWLTQWKLIGPFDSTGGAGFEKVYPPEHTVDLAAEHDGKNGKVRWQDYETKHEYGMVDFNQPFTRLKEVAGYAYTEFYSDAARPVELRLGCKNAWKIWLNGTPLFGRDEYHRGAEIDQYRLRAELKPGKNTLLVKCCQNEQKEDWTVEWEFQLRITDAQGTPIASGL
ncbi:MAG: DUF3387 domain-containing protein [Verrucomicrobiales bacterium]|nr:DUF3387 domain-containing protein [Verrucomicrobiales bacterium]